MTVRGRRHRVRRARARCRGRAPRATFEGGMRGMRGTGLNRSKRQRIVTALAGGTSRICCLIAKTSSAPKWLEIAGEKVQFDVLGFGHHRAEGLKGGMVTHLDRAEHCIR